MPSGQALAAICRDQLAVKVDRADKALNIHHAGRTAVKLHHREDAVECGMYADRVENHVDGHVWLPGRLDQALELRAHDRRAANHPVQHRLI